MRINKKTHEHFAQQFMNDLLNSDVSDLSQIKWIFYGSKNPANFRQNMLNAIDDLPLTDELANKFLSGVRDPNVAKLRETIKSEFDNVFQLIK